MEPLSVQLHPKGEVADYLRPFLVVYKDGRIHRFVGTATVPPSSDSSESVQSKDVQILPEVSARLYLPKSANNTKLPLLIYFHGGGFVIESAKSPTYHNYLNRVAVEASAVIVSVDYRLAPEHPLPTAFDDSWSAVLWSLSLSDPWLSQFADLNRVFFAGDSAGATIAHNMAIRFGKSGPEGANLVGLVLAHPYFSSNEPDPNENPKSQAEREFEVKFWRYLCPEESGLDHPWINPAVDGSLPEVATKKTVVFVAEEDSLRDRGIRYGNLLRESDWPGEVHVVEHVKVGHVFHLLTPENPNCEDMMNKLVEFINQD